VNLPRIQKVWIKTDKDDPSKDAEQVRVDGMVPPNPETRHQKSETLILDPNPEPRAPKTQTGLTNVVSASVNESLVVRVGRRV
jgi:hypothetical protein